MVGIEYGNPVHYAHNRNLRIVVINQIAMIQNPGLS